MFPYCISLDALAHSSSWRPFAGPEKCIIDILEIHATPLTCETSNPSPRLTSKPSNIMFQGREIPAYCTTSELQPSISVRRTARAKQSPGQSFKPHIPVSKDLPSQQLTSSWPVSSTETGYSGNQ